ncbi:hypothetical protein E2C01_071954 [Portunus trituberculatus]|uniref:Uncharacterized protein n=1 Tax=Portunus trituberculatus TaxID=210409 RepID=A0A5B7I9D3_PORTR|nr:hypothetical protein [Portunus trituberculatus]
MAGVSDSIYRQIDTFGLCLALGLLRLAGAPETEGDGDELTGRSTQQVFLRLGTAVTSVVGDCGDVRRDL